MATLVDSNVLLDVMTEDAVWAAWSSDALAAAADRSVLVINPLIYGTYFPTLAVSAPP
jgi:hypothetical protein